MKTEFKFNPNIFGIDGSRNGWVLSFINQSGDLSLEFTDNLVHYFDDFRDVSILIDMPVYLPNTIDDYPRKSEIMAKQYLGKKHSSIFYAPLEKWLDLEFLDINIICTQYNKPKQSKQSYNLFKKIKEVQLFLESKPNFTIYEGHPECFFNHHLIHHPKKTTDGIMERFSLLKKVFPEIESVVKTFINSSSHIAINDCLDSISMLIAMSRIIEGNYRSFNDVIYY